MFSLEPDESYKMFRVRFSQQCRVCQTLCGFAAVHMFFMAFVREGEDVERPGSCSYRGLGLGHVVGLEQYLGTVGEIL